MKDLTLVCPYYCERDLLAFQCGVWFSYADEIKQRLRIIVVDDASPRDPAGPLLERTRDRIGFDLQVLRINEDIGWNCGGAKNLGVAEATTEWVVLLDIDHVLPEDSVRNMLDAPKLDRLGVYTFKRTVAGGQRRRPAPEVFLLRRDTYCDMGGYDEDHCSRSGCVNINDAIDAHTHGRIVLRNVWSIDVRFMLPDPNEALRVRERRIGAAHATDVIARKASGELPPRAHDQLRFTWARIL